MIFLSNAGSDADSYSVYCAVNGNWVHVQDLTVMHYEELRMLGNGDFSKEGGGRHAVLHWNGTRFVTAKKWRTVAYWDGHGWVQKELSRSSIRQWGDRVPREYAAGDFTGENVPEDAFSVPYSGNPNLAESYILRKSGTDWQVIFGGARFALHCIRPDGRGGFVGVADTLDKGMMSDLACAPDGERCEALRRYRWNGETFALMQRWHEPKAQDIGSCSNPAPEKAR